MLETGSARLEASEVVSGGFDEDGVKLHIIGIFDNPADWFYICYERTLVGYGS